MLPAADHDRLMSSWQKWRLTISEIMDTIHDALENKDYSTANELMSTVTFQQAQVTVKMTNILIRHGIIGGEDPND